MKIFNRNVLLGLVGDDLETINEIVNSYKQTLPSQTEELQKSLDTENFNQVKFYAHSIKGGAGNLGGERLYQLAGEIEQAAINGKNGVCMEKIPLVQDELKILLKALDEEKWT